MVEDVTELTQGAEPMVRRRRRLLIFYAGAAGLALSSGFAFALQAQAPTFPASPALDRLITQQMADAGIMGLGAAVIVDRQVAWMKGYGFADRWAP